MTLSGTVQHSKRDKSFVTWFDAGHDDVRLVLPPNQWVHSGAVVLSTNPEVEVGTHVHAGDDLLLQGTSVLVLRQT